MMAPEPNFNDVIRCVFKIKDYEIEVYFYLLDHPESTIAEVSVELFISKFVKLKAYQTLDPGPKGLNVISLDPERV